MESQINNTENEVSIENNEPKKPRKIGINLIKALYPVVVFIVIQYVVVYVYMISYVLYQGLSGPDGLSSSLLNTAAEVTMQNALLLTLISDAISLCIFVLLYKHDTKRLGRKIRFEPQTYDFIVIIVMAITSNYVVSFIITEFNLTDYFSGYDSVIETLSSGSLLLQIVAVAIIAPLTEEFLMRGLVLTRLRNIMPAWPAIIIQGIIFGLIHGNVIQGSYAALLGILLGIIYVRYGKLLPCIVFHIALNSYSVFADYISSSSDSTSAEVAGQIGGIQYYAIMIFLMAIFIGSLVIFLIRTKKPQNI